MRVDVDAGQVARRIEGRGGVPRVGRAAHRDGQRQRLAERHALARDVRLRRRPARPRRRTPAVARRPAARARERVSPALSTSTVCAALTHARRAAGISSSPARTGKSARRSSKISAWSPTSAIAGSGDWPGNHSVRNDGKPRSRAKRTDSTSSWREDLQSIDDLLPDDCAVGLQQHARAAQRLGAATSRPATATRRDEMRRASASPAVRLGARAARARAVARGGAQRAARVVRHRVEPLLRAIGRQLRCEASLRFGAARRSRASAARTAASCPCPRARRAVRSGRAAPVRVARRFPLPRRRRGAARAPAAPARARAATTRG